MHKEDMSRTKIAWGLTWVWLALLVILILVKLEGSIKLSLNEIGDFLAGAMAPLAFLWLIIGYFQQNDELKQNNKSLEYQLTELKNSVEQQRELVEVTREEVEISKSSLRRQEQKEFKNAQPEFRFSIGSLSGSKQEWKQYGKITNHGARVIDIIFKTDNILKINPTSITYLNFDTQNEFEVKYPKELQNNYTSQMLVEYTDSLGNREKLKYKIFRNASGSIEIEHKAISA